MGSTASDQNSYVDGSPHSLAMAKTGDQMSDDTLEQRHNDEPERHRRATTLTTGHIEAYGRNWKGETLG